MIAGNLLSASVVCAENWASALPKKPSQVPAWDKGEIAKRDKNKLGGWMDIMEQKQTLFFLQ